METGVSDARLVAYCGLYCGACRRYTVGKCSGCRENHKAAWCKLRTCGMDNGYTTCADCREFADPMACKKFNNFMSKLFGMLFKSDRTACIAQIREVGVDAYANQMHGLGSHTIKR